MIEEPNIAISLEPPPSPGSPLPPHFGATKVLKKFPWNIRGIKIEVPLVTVMKLELQRLIGTFYIVERKLDHLLDPLSLTHGVRGIEPGVTRNVAVRARC